MDIEILDNASGRFVTLPDAYSIHQHKVVTVLIKVNTTSNDILAIRGKLYDISMGLKLDNSANSTWNTVRIGELDGAERGTGLTLWDGAVVLSKYLDANNNLVKNRRVLELGSGTGLCGITAHLLGAKETLLSDLHYCLHNLKENINLNVDNNSNNHPNVISVTAIDWSNHNTFVYPYDNDTKENLPWDVIIGADIVWIEQLIEPLVTCLYHLSSQQTNILISHQKRSEGADKLFFTTLNKYFTITTIPQQQHHPLFSNSKISILNIKRK